MFLILILTNKSDRRYVIHVISSIYVVEVSLKAWFCMFKLVAKIITVISLTVHTNRTVFTGVNLLLYTVEVNTKFYRVNYYVLETRMTSSVVGTQPIIQIGFISPKVGRNRHVLYTKLASS